MLNLDALGNYELEELTAFSKQIESEIKKRKSRNKTRQKLLKIASSAGITITIEGDDKPEEAIKYRNQENPQDAWTGKGRRPPWLAAALKQGKKLEDYEVIYPEPAAIPGVPPFAPANEEKKKSWT